MSGWPVYRSLYIIQGCALIRWSVFVDEVGRSMRMRAGDRILTALCVIVVASGMACAPKQPPATSPQAEGSATSPGVEASAPSDARKGAEAGQAEEGTQADTPPLNPSQVSADDEPARPAASGNAPGLTPDPTADDGVSDAQLMDAEAQRSVEALDEGPEI